MELSPEARKVATNWINHNAERINSTCNEKLQSIYSKYDIYFFRFTLLLHLLNEVTGNNIHDYIDKQAVANAWLLADYFISQAVQVMNVMKISDPLAGLSEVEKTIYKALPVQFNTGEGWTIVQGSPVDVARRTYDKFIKKDQYFRKIKHGLTAKLFP